MSALDKLVIDKTPVGIGRKLGRSMAARIGAYALSAFIAHSSGSYVSGSFREATGFDPARLEATQNRLDKIIDARKAEHKDDTGAMLKEFADTFLKSIKRPGGSIADMPENSRLVQSAELQVLKTMQWGDRFSYWSAFCVTLLLITRTMSKSFRQMAGMLREKGREDKLALKINEIIDALGAMETALKGLTATAQQAQHSTEHPDSERIAFEGRMAGVLGAITDIQERITALSREIERIRSMADPRLIKTLRVEMRLMLAAVNRQSEGGENGA